MSDDRPGGRDGSHVSLGVLGEKFPETGNYSPCMHDKDNRGKKHSTSLGSNDNLTATYKSIFFAYTNIKDGWNYVLTLWWPELPYGGLV